MAGGNRKGTHDIAPMIRAAFVRACARKEANGNELATMIERSLEDDFLGTLNAVSKFTVRETKLDANVSTSIVSILAGIGDRESAADDSALESESDSLCH